MLKIDVTLELVEEMLGTKAADPRVFATYIASKRPDGASQDELDAAERAMREAEQAEEAGTSIFHRDAEGCSGIYDYQVRGFFKSAWQAMREADDSVSAKLAAGKTKIDRLIFVTPRFIVPTMPEGAELGVCERPLGADTPKGHRVTVARSETMPAGTRLSFAVRSLAAAVGKGEKAVGVADLVREWLEYGALYGLGQWRNSGKGRFVIVEES
jgi:hypothetical protein